MKLIMFTDGGCLHNGRPGAKASWAYYFPEHTTISEAGCVPSDQTQTNNRGELLGILNGINKAIASFQADDIDIHIYTDSEYSKNCLTTWMPGWIRKGWITSSGTPVLNKDLIQAISSRLMMFQSYCIHHVRAHTGGDDDLSRHNHTVDRMAAGVLEEPSDVSTSTTLSDIAGCPLQLVGPPVSEPALVNWCRTHLDSLDETALNTALLGALSKTMRKNGCSLVKQRFHRTTQYRVSPLARIITDTHKDEE